MNYIELKNLRYRDSSTVAEFLRDLQHGADPVEYEKFRETRLRETWKRAQRSKYYADIGPFSWDAFHALPVVSKDALKADPFAFEAVCDEEIVKYYESSGTSGIATPTRRTLDDIVWNYAGVSLEWGKLLQPADRSIILLPSDISPIGDLIAGVSEIVGACVFRSFPFTQGIVSWDRIEAAGERYRPNVVWGSPGTVLQLMRVLKQRGSFTQFAASVDRIFLLGEVVADELAKQLSKYWSATVFNASYGSTETGTIAAATPTGDLRVLDLAYHCEIRTNDGLHTLQPDLEGELVITTLNGYARPLIRVGMGDLVRVGEQATDGALTLSVLGRTEETTSICGKRLSVLTLENIIYRIIGVTGYQLVFRDDTFESLKLERDVDQEGKEEELFERARATLREEGLFVPIKIVGQLPLSSKSGAGLKSWKRSNVARI